MVIRASASTAIYIIVLQKLHTTGIFCFHVHV